MDTIIIIHKKEKWDTLSAERKLPSQETNWDTFKAN